MNKFMQLLLLFCFAFTLESNAMQQQKALQGNLGTLKTNLGFLENKLITLGQKLGALKDKLFLKKQPKSVASVLSSLNVYALYGDNPTIINAPGTTNTRTDKDLEKDATGNLLFAERKNIPFTGYGYKTANLSVLKNMTAHLSTMYPGVKFAVPDFIGISSENIKNYLTTRGLNINERWQAIFVKPNPTTEPILTETEKTDSLASKILPPKFITAINAIETSIKNTFLNNANKDKNLDDVFKTQGLNKFLNDATGLKLMVRSTGKEDTDQLANAGGNETIGNINPTTIAILTAMGQGQEDPVNKGEFKLGVVSSYFGLKSFTQRIKAGDPSIYEEPPTPALIQVMIGETPEEITSCGVMFTEEPEGGISQKKELVADTGQIKTTGITRIECSYGHNEGVVNSMVPVDVYYIDNQQSINSIIREKTKRVIPSPKGFKITTNDKDIDEKPLTDKTLSISPALSKEEVKALKTLSNYLEFYYKKPMDVEFVLKKAKPDDKKRTIYLVQARPIVHNEKSISPSYIFDLSKFAEKITGEVIGVAGGELKLVKNKDECVIAETLKEALEVYQKRSNTDNINCIFVKNMAPATSHEATQFRTEQKAVICFPDVSTIEKLLTEGKQILVDIQQEVAVVWNKDIDLTQALTDKDSGLHEGWINYPIPMKLTLDDRMDATSKKKKSKLDITEINKNLNTFLTLHYFKDVAANAELQTQNAITKIVKDKSSNKLYPTIDTAKTLKFIKECFASIKKDDEDKAKLNLLKLCLGASALVEKMFDGKEDDADFIYQTNLILNHLLIHAKNISNVLNIKPSDANYYQRLYEVRFLEAILFQAPSKDIFNNYSLESLTTRIYAKEKSIEKELGKHGITAADIGAPEKLEDPEIFKKLVQYAKAADFILTDDVKKQWLALLKQLPGTSKLHQDNFNKMFKDLAINNLLTIWFLLSFEPTTTTNPGTHTNKPITNASEAQDLITQLTAEYTKDKPFITALKTQRDKFNELDISLWNNAHKFIKQKQNLEKIGAYFKDLSFFVSYNAATNLGKVFATQIMEEFITLFDTSIKELESSLKEYPDEKTLINNVKILITLFLGFLGEWINNFPGAKDIDGAGLGIGTQTKTQLKLLSGPTALSGILPTMSTFTHKDQIKISPKFNVGKSAIGGSDKFVTNLTLTTLEDIFTFTHQSLLNILGYLNKQLNMTNLSLPPILEKLKNELETNIKTIACKFETYTAAQTGYSSLPNTANFSSMSFQRNKLIRKYNYPLRSHSMIVLLTYDIATKKAQVICEMSGENEYNRFTKIADYEDVCSKVFNLKMEYKIEDKKVTWIWEVDKNTPNESIEKIKNLILASSGMSFATDSYKRAMGIEAEIYKKSLAIGVDPNSFLKLDQKQNQKLLDEIIDYSLKESRLHSVFVTALENLPLDITSSSNWLKIIEILGRLIKESDQYRINTECFFFKKYYSPSFGDVHPILDTLNIGAEWHNLTPSNYFTSTITKDMDLRRKYFKFREAKKIFNYLCQVSEYFDQACWNNFLDLIKANPEFVLTLQDLPLDDMEGDGPTHPAAANLTAAVAPLVKTLTLQNSISKLFENAFKSTVAGAKNKAKETAEALITMGITGGKPEWVAVKDLILNQYTPIFGAFSDAKMQAAVMQSINTNPKGFLAQANAEDLFKLVYPTKKAALQTFIASLGNFAIDPNDQISQGAFKILTYLKNQGENFLATFDTLLQKIKVDQDTLLQQQKNTDLITRLYDLAPSPATFLAEAEAIAQKAIKSPTPAIKSEGVKLAKFILLKNPTAAFNPADLIDLQDIKNNIELYTINDTPDKKGENAIKELIAMGTANKALVQDPLLINTIKNQIQTGYSSTVSYIPTTSPNVLDLYSLISQEIYTDPNLIAIAKADLIKNLGDHELIKTMVPGTANQVIQRNKIKDFTIYMINKNTINTESEILPNLINFLAKNYKRIALFLISILFESNFISDDFLASNALDLVLTRLNANIDATEYSRIAQDCYTALSNGITSKKYSAVNIAKLKNKFVTLNLTYIPESYTSKKLNELNATA